MGACRGSGGDAGTTFKIDGGTMTPAKVPILAQTYSGRKQIVEYKEADGWTMDVDGTPVYLHKRPTGSGYILGAYGYIAKTYDTKKAAVENAAKDARDVVARLPGGAAELSAQLEAVKAEGKPITPQKLSAIRRKIQQDLSKRR